MGKRHDPDEGLRRHIRLTRELTASGPLDLVAWSETSDVHLVAEDQADVEYPGIVHTLARRPHDFRRLSSIEKSNDERKYVLFNSALLADKSGGNSRPIRQNLPARVRRISPFGDMLPVLYDWSRPEHRKVHAGDLARGLLHLGGHKVNVHI